MLTPEEADAYAEAKEAAALRADAAARRAAEVHTSAHGRDRTRWPESAERDLALAEEERSHAYLMAAGARKYAQGVRLQAREDGPEPPEPPPAE